MNATAHILGQGNKKAVALGAVVIAAIIVATATYYARQARFIEEEKQDYAALLLNMAENGMRAHLRGESYHPEHVEDWFLGLVVAAQLGGIQLSGAGGETIMSLGVYAQPAEETNGAAYMEARRVLPALESLPPPRGWRRSGPRGPGQGPGMGPGRGGGMGWRDLPPGPFTFAVALDDAPWRERRAELLARTGAGAALTFLCAGLLAALFLLRERQTQLRVHLVGAKEQATRQTMLAQLGAGLAHETKNPLGLIRGLAQGMRDQPDIDKAARKRLSDIIDETDRVVGRIDSFLTFAKPVEPEIGAVALAPLFSDISALLRDEAAASNIKLTLDDAGLVIKADADLLRRALVNLLLNAFKACKDGGEVHGAAIPDNQESARIVVRDTGCGISDEDLPHITTPYFSRFEDGVGLGLALTDEIARAHGWQLTFSSTPGQGTEARLGGISIKETMS